MNGDRDFYEKERLEGNVEALMSDLTVGTRSRRARDAQTLSKIREKQNTSNTEEKIHKHSIGEFIKERLHHIKKDKHINYDMSATEIIAPHEAVRKPAVNTVPIVFEEAFDEYADTVVIDEDDGYEDTVVMEEEDYDATVVMEEDTPKAVVEFNVDDRKHQALLMSGRTRIGSKSGANDIVIDSKRVSRNHAEILSRDNALYVKDCGSTNGTYINDSVQRLTKETEYRINIGDTITMADVVFIVKGYGEISD